MSGLDNILSRLDKECNEQCEAILEEARIKAEKTVADASAQAEADLQLKVSTAEKQAASILSKSASAAQANERRALLYAKVELIDDILNKALIKLHGLDEPSYFTVLEKLAQKNALSGKGTMYLCSRDLERLPSDFLKELSDIEISDSPVDINDGFILKYGDIEVNCTFSAMLDSSRDELKAVAGEILFG